MGARGVLGAMVLAWCLLGAAPASAELQLFASSAGVRGQIVLYVHATTDIGAVAVAEGSETLGQVALAPKSDARRGQIHVGRFRVPWRCDRRARAFTVSGTSVAGVTESTSYSLRTPSCRTRLALTAPARARPGERVVFRVSDTWTAEPLDATLCVRPPRRTRRCRTVRAGGPAHAQRVTRRGRWRVVLHGTDQKIVHSLAVGVPVRQESSATGDGVPVLVTGDSMMQSVDAVLGDRLAGRAGVISDIRIATGLAAPGLSWARAARRQVAAHAPAATVLMLGVNDSYPLRTPGGDVHCCDEPWIAAYARRAGELMRIYAQGGAGEVIWLTVPAARDAGRSKVYAAINTALTRAAAANSGTFLLRAEQLLTPGGGYRDAMTVDGRRVRVREPDGIHVAIPGAKLLATQVIRRLRATGLLTGTVRQ